MYRNQKRVSGNGMAVPLFALLNAVVLKQAFLHSAAWYWALCMTLPCLLFFLFFFYTNQRK